MATELVWSDRAAAERLATGPVSPTRAVIPDVRALELFVRLADAPAEEILHFAEGFGVLYICGDHGLPSTHYVSIHAAIGGFHVPHGDPAIYDPEIPDPEIREAYRARKLTEKANYIALYKRGFFNRCKLNILETGEYWEPLQAWRKYSREGQALLRIAAGLRAGQPGADDDWAVFYGRPLAEGVSLSDRRFFVSLIVDHWLTLGAVRPHLIWSEAAASISFGSRSLFGTLATQLLLAVGTTRALAICAGCGRFFAPTRHPKPDRRSYCSGCGRRTAVRDASRDYQRKKVALKSRR